MSRDKKFDINFLINATSSAPTVPVPRLPVPRPPVPRLPASRPPASRPLASRPLAPTRPISRPPAIAGPSSAPRTPELDPIKENRVAFNSARSTLIAKKKKNPSSLDDNQNYFLDHIPTYIEYKKQRGKIGVRKILLLRKVKQKNNNAMSVAEAKAARRYTDMRRNYIKYGTKNPFEQEMINNKTLAAFLKNASQEAKNYYNENKKPRAYNRSS